MSPADAMEALTLALVQRASQAEEGDTLDEQTQEDMHTLAELAHDPGALQALLEEGGTEEFAEPQGCPGGATALAQACGLLGVEVSPEEVSPYLGGRDDCPPEQLYQAARQIGLEAQALEGMTLPQLERHLIQGHPVIVRQGGKWVVASAAGQGVISLLGEAGDVTDVPRQEFESGWVDESPEGKLYSNFGIIVRGIQEG